MVGDKLREAREKQNLTVKDIEKGTSIRALYIECIENGDYGRLPGEVYTKGFIRNYANYLKLDSKELVQEFVAERHPEKAAAASTPAQPVQPAPATPAKEPAAAAEPPAAPAVKPVPEDEKKTQAPAPQPARRSQVQQPQQQKKEEPLSISSLSSVPSSSGSNRGRLALLIAVLVIVVGGAAYLLGSSSSDEKAAPPQQTQQAAAPAEEKTYDGVEVTGKFSDDCWIEVKADDKVVYEGTLKKGDSMDWKGQEKVTVRAGNAGAVEFTVNGKDLGKAGKEGQVANKTFTKDAN